MNHLIVLANPSLQSYCSAIRDRILQTVERSGHNVLVRDLYADGFEPILSADDFAHFLRGKLPKDVLVAQAELRDADVLHLVYPIWWTGMPAIMKGYIDRVFTPGFAYRRKEDGVVEPLLTGKRAMVWNTHGNTREEYEANGMYDALGKTSDDGILRYVGIEVLEHSYLAEIRATSVEEREGWLAGVEQKLNEQSAL